MKKNKKQELTQIEYYQRFAANVGLAVEYGRRETKDQLMERLTDALKELASMPDCPPKTSPAADILSIFYADLQLEYEKCLEENCTPSWRTVFLINEIRKNVWPDKLLPMVRRDEVS